MLWLFRNAIRSRLIRRSDTSEACWHEAWRRLPLLRGLRDDDALRLRQLAALFLHEKSLDPVGGFALTTRMRQMIALQASLPVLNLGFDWLDGWVSVIVYPDVFVSDVAEQDDAGVVHERQEVRSGESWDRGPLVISWSDVEAGLVCDGNNVILHEIAHKLDALDGEPNGKPPLHSRMSIRDWSEVFNTAFDDFTGHVDSGAAVDIDPYAATSPAEFFAVLSEAFFEVPQQLCDAYPAAYEQMTALYRQDPLERLAGQANFRTELLSPRD